MNLEQTDVKIVNISLSKDVFVMHCKTQHMHTCHNQRQLRHISWNIIIIVLNI